MSGYRSDSTDNTVWVWLIAILAVLITLDSLWMSYRLPIFYVTLAGIGVGLGTSFYFTAQIHQLRSSQQTEDSIIAWGGLAVWMISAVTALLALHHPLYEDPTGAFAELELWAIHAAQFIGMLFLLICVTTMALLQFITASFYRKRQRGTWAGGIERTVWEWRVVIFAGVAILLIVAFLLSTGVVF